MVELSLEQQFELTRLKTEIDNLRDLEVAKELLYKLAELNMHEKNLYRHFLKSHLNGENPLHYNA